MRVTVVAASGLRPVVHHKHLYFLLCVFYKHARIDWEEVFGHCHLLRYRVQLVVRVILCNVMLDYPIGVRV